MAKEPKARAPQDNAGGVKFADIPQDSKPFTGRPITDAEHFDIVAKALHDRVCALEAYIERNHKLLGWPEF